MRYYLQHKADEFIIEPIGKQIDRNFMTKQTVIKEIRSWLIFLPVLAAVYFGIRGVQNYLGKEAFKQTGLPAYTLSEAIEHATRENKLVLADLSAYWCGACRKLDKTILSRDDVKARINEKYIFARIDSESEEAKLFIRRYGARGYPTLLVLDEKGSKLRQLPLTFDPERFVDAL